MVNRIDRNAPLERISLAEPNSPSYGTRSHPSTPFMDQRALDDVIAHLANAHENRRARQVTEWERMRTQHVH